MYFGWFLSFSFEYDFEFKFFFGPIGFLFCSLRNEVELSARMYAMVRRFLTFAHSANMHPDCDLIRRGRDKRERENREILRKTSINSIRK